jgi:hypothetical protein
MAHIFENTHLWKSTLASRGEQDPDEATRERLRNTFLSFRGRVALLAAEIHRHLPDYTVHDITHLDALWEMADIITKRSYTLTPTEAFVLGGAILLHDLGMGLASYPGGVADLQKEETWRDIVTVQFQSRYERRPTENEIANPPEDIKSTVIAILLRNLHAKHAEQLAFTHWETKLGEPSQHLIDDIEIRQTFGRVIGSIAHSHWWAVSKLEDMFPRTLGAPPWSPNDWTVDPLKIACMLRVADASHIDARRAPTFLRAVRKPGKYSDEHWSFQEKLQKPYLSEDALTYTSGYAFPLEEAQSWWLCLDTLTMIDKELRQVDALLAEKTLQRFAARRIAGIESPERLVSYIPTDNWLPVDAPIQVSEVPRLIEKLGGSELYGRDLKIPLREMIQNAADAIRARRHVENRSDDWGTIKVKLGEDTAGEWLEVEDNGIGMSEEVLTRYLLDFGSSYWGSDLMINEFPGLIASGVQLTGKYGIGFFSIFMLGSAVRIRTQQIEALKNETLVLEFNTGLSARPILRLGKKDERIRDGGTIVKVWLSTPTDKPGGLLATYNENRQPTLTEACRAQCQSLDVTIEVHEKNGLIQLLPANEWLRLSDEDFLLNLRYTSPSYSLSSYDISEKQREVALLLAPNLRVITDNGEVVGRACVSSRFSSGVVTVGGLKASMLSGITGILVGKPERAARDAAQPIISKEALSKWADEQSKLIPTIYKDPKEQAECAEVIVRCGGDVSNLPVAQLGGEWVSYQDILDKKDLPDEIYIDISYRAVNMENLSSWLYLPHVIKPYHRSTTILQNSIYSNWPSVLFYDNDGKHDWMRFSSIGTVMRAIAKVWGVAEEIIVEQYRDENNHSTKIVSYIGSEEWTAPVTILRKPT